MKPQLSYPNLLDASRSTTPLPYIHKLPSSQTIGVVLPIGATVRHVRAPCSLLPKTRRSLNAESPKQVALLGRFFNRTEILLDV